MPLCLLTEIEREERKGNFKSDEFGCAAPQWTARTTMVFTLLSLSIVSTLDVSYFTNVYLAIVFSIREP